MGFQRNDGNIIIDMVLTSLGRKKLAQGNFNVTKYSFADDEIDYGLYTQATGSVNQDAEILKTVIMEANTDERLAVKYPCVSISDDSLYWLPKLDASTDPLTLNERDQSVSGKVVEWQQNTYSAKRKVPEEILDGTFTLHMNNELLGVQNVTPRSITADNVAVYTLKRNDINSVGGAKIAVPIIVKYLENETWDELGTGTKPNRTITTSIWIRGNGSGLNSTIVVTISEALSR